MLEKVRKYVKEHETEVYVVLASANVIAAGLLIRALSETTQVSHVLGARSADGMIHVQVFTKNGAERSFSGFPRQLD